VSIQTISLAEAMCLGVHEQFLGLLFKPEKLHKQELLSEASYCCETQPLIGRITQIRVITKPIPVAARSKAWVCGRSLAGIAGSNPVGGMDVCFL